MGKPVPVEIPSDDCVLQIGEEAYHVHEGEWVRINVGMPVKMFEQLEGLMSMHVKMQALDGQPDESMQTLALMNQNFDGLCELLSRRIVEWNWTDDAGNPIPSPQGKPEVLKQLRTEELVYLLKVVQGETPKRRKNASRPSRITSSAIA